MARPLYISTSDAHASLGSMKILYSVVTGDHIPISFTVIVQQLPALSTNTSPVNQGKLDWSSCTKEALRSYFIKTDKLLNSIYSKYDAIRCTDANCDEPKEGYLHFLL